MKKLSSVFVIALLMFTTFLMTSCDDETGGTTTTACETDGTLDQSTIAEIEDMRQAMVTFRTSLSESLLEDASNCLDDERFYLWHNTPADGNRDGITYGDLSATQLSNFKAVLQLFLSTDGYQKVYEITELAEALLEENNSSVWSPDYYSIDMFGDPATSGSWGFQLDGHHCAINFLVHGDNVSIAPAFLAGEPTVDSYNGTSFDIFKDERDLAISLFNGFTSGENTSAVSSGNRSMEVGPADQNGNVDPYRGNYDYSGFATGLKYSDMSTTTQANLVSLMKEYVYNMSTTFADEWWNDINTNIDDTYFVFISDATTLSTTSEFYYRIYNPYLWVEYNNEGSVGGAFDDWNHVHTITRIPDNPTTENGGDYGIFVQFINNGTVKFLDQHYHRADHHKDSKMKLDYHLKEHNHSGHSHSHNHKS